MAQEEFDLSGILQGLDALYASMRPQQSEPEVPPTLNRRTSAQLDEILGKKSATYEYQDLPAEEVENRELAKSIFRELQTLMQEQYNVVEPISYKKGAREGTLDYLPGHFPDTKAYASTSVTVFYDRQEHEFQVINVHQFQIGKDPETGQPNLDRTTTRVSIRENGNYEGDIWKNQQTKIPFCIGESASRTTAQTALQTIKQATQKMRQGTPLS